MFFKDNLKNFKNGIDDLQEIGKDIRIFIVSLPQNNDYRDLVGLINSL